MHYMLNMKNMYWPYHEKHKVTKNGPYIKHKHHFWP